VSLAAHYKAMCCVCLSV